MKLIIDIPEMAYEAFKEWHKNKVATVEQSIIANGKPYEKSLQGELANEVWQLYEKHQAHLATHVIEFGDDLKELLGKYQKGGAE